MPNKEGTMSDIKPVDAGIFILRLTLGIIIAAHGLQKVLGLWGGPGIEGFSGFVKSLGFQPPVVWAWIVGLSETVGGALLVLGVLPRLSAFFIGSVMAVAIFKVHWNGLFMANNGFEYPLLILACCVAVIFTGAGKISLFDKL
ncbi:MAG: DoxX family membrane protein [Candidatus Omnitrophica bacterium]|nr:DoxX family membrane protein [Candidatus Omnitrophota bacterium]